MFSEAMEPDSSLVGLPGINLLSRDPDAVQKLLHNRRADTVTAKHNGAVSLGVQWGGQI